MLKSADWKHATTVSDNGAILGCDFCGIVEEIGSQVTSPIRKGDRVYGFVSGGNVSNHEDGTFAEYCVVKDGLFMRAPTRLNDEEASTLGLGLITCGQALYESLQLPWPNEPATKTFPILIYGGSTATGMLAIQLAKLSGLTVIATAGQHNFGHLKALGADEVFDYKDPECALKIRQWTGNNLHYIFDCAYGPTSVHICANALASSAPPTGLHFTTLAVPSFPRKDVTAKSTWAYFATGEGFEKVGRWYPAKAKHYDFARKFTAVAENLVAEGKVKPVNYTVDQGGLEEIPQGLRELKEGKVSGKKLVYKIASS